MEFFEILALDPVLPTGAWFALVLILVAALGFDFRSRRIPNLTIAIGLIFGIAATTSVHGALGSFYSLSGALVGLFSLFLFFALRLLGAGDVKLLAVIGSFVGPKAILWIVLYTLISGGVLSIVWAVLTGRLGELKESLRGFFAGMSFEPNLLGTKVDQIAQHSVARLPYALAIFAGTCLWVYSGPLMPTIKSTLTSS